MTDANNVGKIIQRLRHDKGMTQLEAAKRSEVSRSAYANIEQGKSVPRNDTVAKILTALSASMADLIGVKESKRKIRFRTSGDLKIRDKILCQVEKIESKYDMLEHALGQKPVNLAETVKGYDCDTIEDLALRVRDILFIGAFDNARPDDCWQEPILDIFRLLQYKAGIRIIHAPKRSIHFSSLSTRSQEGSCAIAVNTWDRISTEGIIFSTARELGHLLIHSDSYGDDRKKDTFNCLAKANKFASLFLMPQSKFRKEWKRTSGLGLVERIHRVKIIFKVSQRTVLSRLLGMYNASEMRHVAISSKEEWMIEYLSLPHPDRSNFYVEPSKAREVNSLPACETREPNMLRELALKAYLKKAITEGECRELLEIEQLELNEVLHQMGYFL